MSAGGDEGLTAGGAPPPTRGDALLLVAFFLGPAAYAVDLTVSYALVPEAARAGRNVALHAVSAAALAAAAGALALSWRGYRRHAGAGDDPSAQRGRFFALGGLGLGALSVLLILATEIPKLLLSPRD